MKDEALRLARHRRDEQEDSPLTEAEPYVGKMLPLVGVQVAYGKRGGKWDHRTQRYLPGPGRPKGSGKKADLTGQEFGRLTVLAEAPLRKSKRYWLCDCECGNQTEVRQDNLLRWRTESCGCQQGKGGKGIPRKRYPKSFYGAVKVAKETGDLGPYKEWLAAWELYQVGRGPKP